MANDNIVRGAWSKYYSENALKTRCPLMTAYGYVRSRNEDNMSGAALDYHGTRFTYGTFFDKIDWVADLYASIGIKKGDIVTILSTAFPETIFTYYALNKMGAVCSFIDPRFSPERILEITALSGSKVMLTVDKVYGKLEGLFEKTSVEKLIVHTPSDYLPWHLRLAYKMKVKGPDIKYDGRTISWKSFEATPITAKAVEAPFEPDRLAIIVQTGGSTGIPKGVMLSNEAINSAALGMQYAEGERDYKGERFLDIMPMFSSYGIVCGLQVPFIFRLENVIVPDFTPEKFPSLIHKYKPNHTIAVPAYYEKLMFDKKTSKDDYSNIVAWASGGDTMTHPLEMALENFVLSHGSKFTIEQGYGMSEVASVACYGYFHKYKHGSVGIPSILNEIRIFEPGTDRELPPGEEGEVCITGSTMMLGYFNEPEETANVIRTHADGRKWIHSGDIGHMDEDGFIFISGRIKRMITRFDGHKIFPVQIEKVVMSYPDVLNCSVIPVTDLGHGQGKYPLVIAELKDYNCDREEARKGILKLCNDTLEERGRPCDAVIVEKIPLTSVGKNDVVELTKEYGEFKYATN